MSIIDALKTQLPYTQGPTSGLGALVKDFASTIDQHPELQNYLTYASGKAYEGTGKEGDSNRFTRIDTGNGVRYMNNMTGQLQTDSVKNPEMSTLPGVPENDTPEKAAARQASRMSDWLSVFNKYAPTAQITQMSNSVLGNGNANFQSGFGNLNLGGQNVAIPNSVLQQVELTARNNRTTWNPQEYWFNREGLNAQAAMGDKAKYTSYDASIGRVNQLNQQYQAQNPQGSINQYKAAQENQRMIEDQMQQLQKQAAQGLTETRDIAGNVTSGTVSAWEKQRADLQQKQAQAAQQMTNLDSRGARVSAEENATRIAGQAWRDYERIFSPTVSNLPIVEIFQPQK